MFCQCFFQKSSDNFKFTLTTARFVAYLSMLTNQKFSMKFVSSQTGLSSDVIRAWEKRYDAIRPERTETNRRLYSANDIARLEKLVLLTKAGHSIGRIARFTDSQLQSLVSDISIAVSTNDKPREEDRENAHAASQLQGAERIINESLSHAAALNERALELTLSHAEQTMGLSRALTYVIEPLTTRLVSLDGPTGVRVAQNNFAVSFLRTFLTLRAGNIPSDPLRPLLLSATPPGQWGEIGAIMANLTAQHLGWRTLFLGPDLPPEEISTAASNNAPTAVALSISEHTQDHDTIEQIYILKDQLKSIPLLVGGSSAVTYSNAVRDAGGILFPDLHTLSGLLARMSP